MPSVSTTFTKNYYQVLGLETPTTSTNASAGNINDADLRAKYRAALIAAHPDKNHATNDSTTNACRILKGNGQAYTVDDVKQAYATLCDVTRRRDYNIWLQRALISGTLSSSHSHSNVTETPGTDFVLGLELLDLNDFEEVAVSQASTPRLKSEGEARGEEVEWVRSCRCGAEKGFKISEVELESASRRSETEVLVGCEGCSLWVTVGFDIEEG